MVLLGVAFSYSCHVTINFCLYIFREVNYKLCTTVIVSDAINVCWGVWSSCRVCNGFQPPHVSKMCAARHDMVQVACGCATHTVFAVPVVPQMFRCRGGSLSRAHSFGCTPRQRVTTQESFFCLMSILDWGQRAEPAAVHSSTGPHQQEHGDWGWPWWRMELQEILEEWKGLFTRHGLKLNLEKTEVLHIGHQREELDIKLEGERLTQGTVSCT